MIKMNEECKYCSYLKQCPDVVEHNSIYCKCHKRIPKDRNMSYEQLQNNWNELKKWLIQLQKFKGINQQGFSWGVAQEVLEKMQELEQGK